MFIVKRQIQEGLRIEREVGKRRSSLMEAMSDVGWVERRRLERVRPGVRGSGRVGLGLGRGVGVVLRRDGWRELGMKTLRKEPEGWYLVVMG